MTLEILFNPPPRNLKLVNGEIHVFCASLDPSPMRLKQLSEILSADELERARRFHFEKDKNRFMAGRGMLREILGWQLDIAPEEIVFTYGAHGKPRLAAPVAGKFLHFNLGHSDSLAVYAISRLHELGVDIELIRLNAGAEEIAAHHFHENERAKLSSLPEAEKTEAFFNCWTRKEAVLKASGDGIGDRLDQIDVYSENPAWSVQSLTPAENYTAAVAANCADASIQCWRWGPLWKF